MKTALSDIIIKKIQTQGPMSFRDFMEMALYYPDLGYYTSGKEKIGVEGDFFTSCSLTPAFGATLARQLEEIWNILGRDEFTIVEYGAGTGSLCHDILNSLKQNREVYEKLNYCIIEKSPAMVEKEKKRLGEKVQWYNSIKEIGNFTGCVLSNELVDNFSIHQVVMKKELMEVFVDYKDDFVELLQPARKELADYLWELKITLPDGYRTEINLEATEWMKEVSRSLKKGYVITIDYGFPSAELYNEYRKDGTLTCYNNHRTNHHPYRHIGEQDITSHVNFSALCLWGYKNGLEYCGYREQGDFLIALGLKDYLKKTRKPPANYLDCEKEIFIRHTLLSEMGSKFKVLVQQKAMNGYKLSGLRSCN